MQQADSIYDLYNKLGDIIAEVLNHEDCPVEVFNMLTSMTMEIDNRAVSCDSWGREVAFAKAFSLRLYVS